VTTKVQAPEGMHDGSREMHTVNAAIQSYALIFYLKVGADGGGIYNERVGRRRAQPQQRPAAQQQRPDVQRALAQRRHQLLRLQQKWVHEFKI